MSDVASLIAEGRSLMARERNLLVAGDFGTVETLAVEKADYLARLERAWPSLEGLSALRDGLVALIEDARRNERLILAAREGIAAARRRIAALEATRSGVVAYASDGSPIRSRADVAGRTKSA